MFKKYFLLIGLGLILVVLWTSTCFKFPTQENKAPNKPVITGDTTGFAPDTIDVSIIALDPDNDQVAYRLDLGSGSQEELPWSAYYPSGEPFMISLIIGSPGIYSIKAMAKDVNEDSSDWSEIRHIIMQ